MSSPSHLLPAHVAPWVDAALGVEIPPESHATCASCAMCEGGGDERRSRGPLVFDPQVKCCAYVPALPNYLVGAILADASDDNAAGRRSTQQRIALGGPRLSPLGLIPGPHAPPKLGAVEPRCPHLDDGRCGIWKHRHAVCSTWFCKHERGAAGQAAWLVLRALLMAVEQELALWCCREAGFEGQVLARVLASTGTVPWLTQLEALPAAQLWGVHRGKEHAFFLACHHRVRDLTWEDVLQICGPNVHVLADAAREAFEGLEQPVPDRLVPGRYSVVATGESGVLAQTYSEADPIGLPAALTSVLHLFDGRPLAQVEAQLEQERGVALAPEYLRMLVDFRVLVAAP